MKDRPKPEFLTGVRHLADLPAEIQIEIAAAARLCRFEAGQVIFLEGEPGDRLYILETGWVKSTRMTRDGREQAMLFLQPGEVFGDISVFTDSPYPGTVTALEEVRLWMIPKAAMVELASRHPALALAMLRRMGERVLHFVSLVEDMSLRSVEARLAKTLLKYTVREGGRVYVPRRSWTTYDEMAVRLGTVRDVLSRALRNLEEEGLIRVERQALYILDEQGLSDRGNP